MERDFQAALIDGGRAGAGVYQPVFSGVHTCPVGMDSTVSFQTLLSVKLEKPASLSLFDNDYGGSGSSSMAAPATLGFFDDRFNPIRSTGQFSSREMNPFEFMPDAKMKKPKEEPPQENHYLELYAPEVDGLHLAPVHHVCYDAQENHGCYRAPAIHKRYHAPVPHECYGAPENHEFCPWDLYGSGFYQMPELRSVDGDFAAVAGSPSRKRLKLSSREIIPYASVPSSYFSSEIRPPSPNLRRKEAAKQRQKTLRDKFNSLKQLMPTDKKMDRATMLEEAHKYIKFLQAQVIVLQSMPPHASNFAVQSDLGSDAAFYGGGLGRLNRQQLLQLVVNSPVAQSVLYSNDCCVYSIEQLVAMMAERKAMYQKMATDLCIFSSSTSHQ